MQLIRYVSDDSHVSFDAVSEFERAIIKSNKNGIHVKLNNKYISAIIYYLFKAINKININDLLLPLLKMPCNVFNDDYFIILMWLDAKPCFPYFLSEGGKYLYIFDVWPNNYEKLVEYANKLNIKKIFVSKAQAVEKLNQYNTKCQFFWIPEGINMEEYRFEGYSEKDIDVLQIGRRYELYHNAVVEHLSRKKIKYYYEKSRGVNIFPTRKSFIGGMARTKISICFPANITHPERAKGIETMTLRYLQSIASKCLILGHAPSEMVKIFGYNPVVEVDMGSPGNQVESILRNYEDYIPLIEKNYRAVYNYTWEHRWEQIMRLIRSQ